MGQSSRPTVALAQGTYAGALMPPGMRLPRDVEAFRGIPYAQSTSGENRFRPPVPLARDGGSESGRVLAATAFGACCPSDGRKVDVAEGEDCLNLNVYRPAGTAAGALLPVAVYVHGGAFNGGLGIERNMAAFVGHAEHAMIGVNFNYRVGALGFLPSALTARLGDGALNLGLRDQQALLAWVRDNIAAFGGDRDRVTLMGLSAGAHSIGHHLMYYRRGDAPFRAAILESGATTARAVLLPTHPRHLVQFREFLVAAGVAAVPEEDLMAALRALPLDAINRASRAVWDRYQKDVCWPFQPAVDGLAVANGSLVPGPEPDPIIPDLPIESWRKGRHLDIPVMTGFNTNEGTLFIPQRAANNKAFESFFKTLIPGLTPADLAALSALYPDPVTNSSSPYRSVPRGCGKQWARLDAAYGQYAYICPVLQTAHFLSSAAASSSNVYLYEFAARSGQWGTANHGDAQTVISHTVSPAAAPGLARVSDAMHGAWARFVATGDPNPTPSSSDGGSGAAVRWEPFVSPFNSSQPAEGDGHGRGAKGRLMVFGKGNDERMGRWGRSQPGTPTEMRALTDAELRMCRFWWDRVELSQGLGTPSPDTSTANPKL